MGTVKKIRFIVVEQNSDKKEKQFYVGRRSARLIIAKLKDGHTLLKIERIGSGKDTLYYYTKINTNDKPRLPTSASLFCILKIEKHKSIEIF